MTYSPSQYQQDCLRTRSEIYRPDLVPPIPLKQALEAAIRAGQVMRGLKRACFGGKPYTDAFIGEAVSANLGAVNPDMLHALMGVINETGEIAEMLHGALFEGKPFDLTNFVEETGDRWWFDMLGCHAAGIAPEEVMRRNIGKLRARFPDKFDPDKMSDEHRDRAAETAALEGGRRYTGDEAANILQGFPPDAPRND